MNAIDGILDKLARLPRADVDAVRLRINTFLSLDKWVGLDFQKDETSAQRVYSIVRREMQAAGLVSDLHVPYNRLPNRTDFAVKAESLLGFIAKQSKDRRVQDGIVAIGVRSLIESMRTWSKRPTLTLNYVCTCLHHVPAVLDREFPGYGAAGLLGLLVKPGR